MSQPPPPEEEEEEEEEEGGGGGGAAPESPPRENGAVYRPGSRRCPRCLITFPDAAFAARHAKRQHPGDFARSAALRGALFVCFVCARPFGSSPALLRHQRGHAHRANAATPLPGGAAPKAAPPGGGRKATPPSLATPPNPATPPLACTECGRAFAREGALHRHYIRHARGEL